MLHGDTFSLWRAFDLGSEQNYLSSPAKHEVQVRSEVAEEVLGAAEDGSVKVFTVAFIAISQPRNPRLTHTCNLGFVYEKGQGLK